MIHLDSFFCTLTALKSLAVRTDAYVFCLVSAQNNFVYSVSLIILQALSYEAVAAYAGHRFDN